MNEPGPACPPINLDAEKSALGTLTSFYTPQAVHIVQAAGLQPNDFYYRAHTHVYRAVLRLHRKGDHVDHITVVRVLTEFGKLEEVGDARLEEFAAYARPAGLREHALIVHEDSVWRQRLAALYDAQASLHDRDVDAFWVAVASIQRDAVPEEPLRVIEGGKAQEKAS